MTRGCYYRQNDENTFRMNKKSISPRELTIEQKTAQKIFWRFAGTYTYLIKL